MLRITVSRGVGDTTHVRVEGRITEDNMGELRSVCERRFGDDTSLVLDVSGVAYCDSAAATLLGALSASGAALVGANGFVSELMGRTPDGATAARAVRAKKNEACAAGDERALVAALRAGDEAAFEQIVRRYGGRLLSVARRVLGNEEDARDALQEAFLSAFRAIGSFTGESLLSTWLHRVVVNACLMRLRSRRRRREESLDDLLPGFAEDGHFLEAPSSWRSDELLEREDARASVRGCIERLPARHREILVLRDIEELDTSEVAAALGITPNAVKVRLHRARQALRTLIEREIVEPEHRRERGRDERARA
jgi:RNA polymerase sigma-70 factor (ECF subfamily)